MNAGREAVSSKSWSWMPFKRHLTKAWISQLPSCNSLLMRLKMMTAVEVLSHHSVLISRLLQSLWCILSSSLNPRKMKLKNESQWSNRSPITCIKLTRAWSFKTWTNSSRYKSSDRRKHSDLQSFSLMTPWVLRRDLRKSFSESRIKSVFLSTWMAYYRLSRARPSRSTFTHRPKRFMRRSTHLRNTRKGSGGSSERSDIRTLYSSTSS